MSTDSQHTVHGPGGPVHPEDEATVRALFDGPGFTCGAAELQARLRVQGFVGPLASYLPLLRDAGLREPRPGVFAPPVGRPTAELLRTIGAAVAHANEEGADLC